MMPVICSVARTAPSESPTPLISSPEGATRPSANPLIFPCHGPGPGFQSVKFDAVHVFQFIVRPIKADTVHARNVAESDADIASTEKKSAG